MNFFKKLFNKSEEPSLKKQLTNMLGWKPNNLALYVTALTHSSHKKELHNNNERLEYLGDAILGAVSADYLFKKYPYKGEGFLTDMRTKIVNRQCLNEIALKIGLNHISIYNKADHSLKNSQIFGNALESIIGAIYVDKGYSFVQRWIIKCIIQAHLSIDDLENLEINHKNKVISWANKHNYKLTFETIDEKIERGQRLFTIAVVLNNEIVVTAKAFNKKDASQIASQLAMKKLGIQ